MPRTYTAEDLAKAHRNGRLEALQDASTAIGLAITYLSWCIASRKFVPNYSHMEMEEVMKYRKIHGFTSWQEEQKIRDAASERGTLLMDLSDNARESIYPRIIEKALRLREESYQSPEEIE